MTDHLAFEFGSVSGSTVAFCVFLGISLFIGFGVYYLLTRPEKRRAHFRRWPALQRRWAAPIGLLLTLLLFGWIYFDVIHGFYRLEVGENELRLTYILPKYTVAVPFDRLGEVARERDQRGARVHWRLVVYTKTGAHYTSAQSGYAEVKDAWQRINAFLEQRPRPER